MSWLWGDNKGSDPPKPTSFNDLVQPQTPEGPNDGDSGDMQQQYRFDSSGMEKAAEFASEIGSSGKCSSLHPNKMYL